MSHSAQNWHHQPSMSAKFTINSNETAKRNKKQNTLPSQADGSRDIYAHKSSLNLLKKWNIYNWNNYCNCLNIIF